MISLCFVCLGNICRSPTAEGVMLGLLTERDLGEHIRVDSAGTSSYHTDAPADSRSLEAAHRRGIVLPSRSRQFQAEDFDKFDYVLACDTKNLEDLGALASREQKEKLHLFLDFDPSSPEGTSVPDPHYGGEQGFEAVLDLCQSACGELLEYLVDKHGL